MKKLLSLTLAALLVFPLTACVTNEEKGPPAEKPVIYLYPEEETEVTVTLDYDGTLTSTYPDYGEGWTVTAQPDGTLTDPDTGREYYCLFWEGIIDRQFDLSTGFCVAGADTAAFLEDALARLGLTEREANAILTHMFPLSAHLPRCREAAVVNIADKLCATVEVVHLYRTRFIQRRLPVPAMA